MSIDLDDLAEITYDVSLNNQKEQWTSIQLLRSAWLVSAQLNYEKPFFIINSIISS